MTLQEIIDQHRYDEPALLEALRAWIDGRAPDSEPKIVEDDLPNPAWLDLQEAHGILRHLDAKGAP